MFKDKNVVREGVLLTFNCECEKINFMDKQAKKRQMFDFVK